MTIPTEMCIYEMWAEEDNRRVQVWRQPNGSVRFAVLDTNTNQATTVFALISYRADDLARDLQRRKYVQVEPRLWADARCLIQTNYDRLVKHWGQDGSELDVDFDYVPDLNMIRDMYHWLND